MSHVIGIDIGTSGIKVGAMDRNGNLGTLEHASYDLIFPQPGWIEIELEEIWGLVQSLVGKVAYRIKQSGGEPEAVSLTCFCNASVFIDETGRPLYNGILYMDQRTQVEAEWIKETVQSERHFAITKNRMEPGIFSVTALLWVRNHRPDLYSRIHRWGHLSSFILYKLTGEFVLDWTQASYSGLYDVANYHWSKELCNLLGIEERLLAEVADPAAVVGRVHPSCGLPLGSIPVVAGGADTACSSLTLGLKPGEIFESVGTSNVLTICNEHPSKFDARFMNRCHIIRNRWLSHGAMSHPGSCIRWFRNTMLSAEESAQKEILEQLAQSSRPGANGIYFLPYLYGERTPIWDIHARGTFVGIDLTSTKADMLQAILEGCAYGLKQISEIIEHNYGISYSSFVSIGGGAGNRHWSQVKSSVLGKRIEVKKVTETAVSGACMLAGSAVGYFDSLENGISSIRQDTLFTVEPDEALAPFYESGYKLFGELYPALQPFFAKAALIR